MAAKIRSEYFTGVSDKNTDAPAYVDIPPPGGGNIVIVVSQYIVERGQSRNVWIDPIDLVYDRFPPGVQIEDYDTTPPAFTSVFPHTGWEKGMAKEDRPNNREYNAVAGSSIANMGLRVSCSNKRKKSTQTISLGILTMNSDHLG